ncbi:MAG: NADH:ubiquinone oxidoreductase subunit NDUFA12 [Alphaproteobacteria bacterium]|nr:MAG: NADH:ubiquinone oxidoreductase subunit NDUFA12 [Alphaproteobacteria bacterium]
MGFFKNLFTWWEGASTGTALYSWHNGSQVGKDDLGNLYFEGRKGGRRWVMYNGSNDVSRVPPEWYSWLTRQIDDVPDKALPPAPKFLKPATANLTGTVEAYRPSGALEQGGQRAAASGDYQPWLPD